LAGDNFEEALGLQQEIDAAVKGKNYERLLPLVKRFLKLKPDNARMQRLAVNLKRNRPERAIRNYKGTGKYFDVAGRLVDVKEIVASLFLIVALFFGVTYGVKHLDKLPTARDLMSSQPPANDVADRKDKVDVAPNRESAASGNITAEAVRTSASWPAAFSRHLETRATGRFLSAFDRQNGAVFWDSSRGLQYGSTFPPRPGSQLLCLDVSPDERWVATAFRNADSRITRIVVWDLTSGEIKRTFEDLAVDVNQLAWHQSGKLFASGASDGRISFWSVDRDRPFSWNPTIIEHLAGISGLTWYPKLSSLVSSSFDGTFKIWYLPEDIDAVQAPIRPPHTLRGYPYGALGTGYDISGKHLIVCGAATIDVWEFIGNPRIRLSLPGKAFAWAPDGNSFVTAGSAGMETEAKRWATESGKMLAHYRGGCTRSITAITFSPTGRLLFTDGSDEAFMVWDVESGRRIPDRESALISEWGPIAADPARSAQAVVPTAFFPAEKASREMPPGSQRPARVAVTQCHPLPIAETGFWVDIPESLHEATVFEPPSNGKSQFRNVVEVEVLEGGALALAAAWSTEPIDPAASINDVDLVTEQQLIDRGWTPTDTITRPRAGEAPDKQRIFRRQVKTGEKFRLATRNLTAPFVIIPN
jgi:WD40 repeat protein